MISKPNLDIFTGTANAELANDVADILGMKMSSADIGYFSDGEIKVEIQENVRGHDIFIIQPTCAPTNKNLMELMLLADALKRSSASRITAVVPYYGYARQE
jgi:ribose-phosphate pyrophosphokinase